MLIKIYEDTWEAEVYISDKPIEYEFVHVQGRILGKSEEAALAGALCILALFAKGRQAHIRTKPEASTDTDFDTKETLYRGYVRFSFGFVSGEWQFPTEIVNLPFSKA